MKLEKDLVFDIGAHRGEDSDYYIRRGFRVVCVECDPYHVAFLRRRFVNEIADGRLILIDRAIAERSGSVEFYRNNSNSVWGTADPRWAERNLQAGTEIEQIVVDAIAPEELFRAHGLPHYLKIDIEGSDMLVVNALAQFATRPAYLSLESEAESFDKLRAEFAALSALGYNKFKLSSQQIVPGQRVPGGSPHGKMIDYAFEYGSSGLFGEDLDGPWLEEREAIAHYQAVFVLYHVEDAVDRGVLRGSFQDFAAAYGYESSWYDTHARHSALDDPSI